MSDLIQPSKEEVSRLTGEHQTITEEVVISRECIGNSHALCVGLVHHILGLEGMPGKELHVIDTCACPCHLNA